MLLLVFVGCGSGDGGNSGSGESQPTTASNGGSAPAAVDSVTLLWDASTTNNDGSPLTDLAGYTVYYGTSSQNYSQSVDIGNYTGAVISNLSPGTWCFAVTAYDLTGNESSYSSEFCTATG